MSSDEEPPPLDDMTPALEKRNAELKLKKQRKEELKVLAEERKVAEKGTDKKFATGLKKGFFDSKPKPKRKVPAEAKIPLIKPKNPGTTGLEIPEVQAAMQYTLEQTDEWLTPDLMTKMGDHPALLAGFQNPRFIQAIEEMRKDPAAAQRKYAGDMEIMLFITEFSKIMAGHFEEVG
jgi:hypothetical protein